jgi:hypothetical protein
MVVFIFSVIIALAVLIFFIREAIELEALFFLAISGIVVSAVVFVGVWMARTLLIGNLLLHQEYSYAKVQLASLQDGTPATGSFFLGSGYVDGDPTYFYYTKQGNAYLYNSTDASGVRVYEDTDKPYLMQQNDCKTDTEWLADCMSFGPVTEIHVPKGTVKSNFILDSKQ